MICYTQHPFADGANLLPNEKGNIDMKYSTKMVCTTRPSKEKSTNQIWDSDIK